MSSRCSGSTIFTFAWVSEKGAQTAPKMEPNWSQNSSITRVQVVWEGSGSLPKKRKKKGVENGAQRAPFGKPLGHHLGGFWVPNSRLFPEAVPGTLPGPTLSGFGSYLGRFWEAIFEHFWDEIPAKTRMQSLTQMGFQQNIFRILAFCTLGVSWLVFNLARTLARIMSGILA